MEKGSGGGAPPAEKDVDGGVVSVRQLETGTKRDLAGMEHPAKKTRVEGSSSSAAAQSSAPGSEMDAAAPVDSPADDIPPPPDAPVPQSPLAGGDSEYELFLRVKSSVVTVSVLSVAGSEVMNYGTGFIISATDQYALVFTSFPSAEYGGDDFYHNVHLEENRQGVRARIVYQDVEDIMFHILVVQTLKKHATVSFMDTPLKYQRVITVGAMAGTILCFGAPVVETLVGKLSMYKGRVVTPNCTALTLQYKHLEGSEKYFEVQCLARDDPVRLEYIDEREHTSHRIESAPVFALSGQVVGLILSAGTYVDVKNGFLCKSIISSIRSMCGADNWQERLQEQGNIKYATLFANG